ncbi:MAG TPA: hypothetical protein EYQ83_01750 [Acidobacteria bacterium]|nr:hypothetical protein [Acidobacteriota bacterium]
MAAPPAPPAGGVFEPPVTQRRAMTAPTAIDAIRAAFQADLSTIATAQDLQSVRDRYLGRKQGQVAALMKSMAGAAPADRPLYSRNV